MNRDGMQINPWRNADTWALVDEAGKLITAGRHGYLLAVLELSPIEALEAAAKQVELRPSRRA
jgi:hypothetical protein